MIEQGYQLICYNWTQHYVSGKDFDDSVSSEYKGVRLNQSIWLIRSFFYNFESCIQKMWCDLFHLRESVRNDLAV